MNSEVRTVCIPASLAEVPKEPRELCEGSIVVEFENAEYLVGEAAIEENPGGARGHHGTFKSNDVRILAKAAAAAAIGLDGEYEIDVSIAAPEPSINDFRAKAGDAFLSSEQFEELQDVLSEIKYRQGSTDSELKTLKLKLKSNTLLHELRAVKEVVPKELIRYSLIQWGHGDLQSICVNNARPVGNVTTTGGLSFAVNAFSGQSGLGTSEGIKAFRQRKRLNGSLTEAVDCAAEVRQSIRNYVSKEFAEHLNYARKHNIKHFILSGGAALDDLAVDELRNFIETRGFKLHLIHEVAGDLCRDPQFSCLDGLSKFARLNLDLGNSSLKAGYRVEYK